jgi:hypothetical protein
LKQVTKEKIYIFLVVSVSFLFIGWGGVGHKIINRKTVMFFPPSMSYFQSWRDSLAAHGSDADYRKDTVPNEEYRHYINIENYKEFLDSGKISQFWDILVAQHNLTFVISNGYVPFAIINYCDTLKRYFMQKNWHQAMLTAADLGHYVGDAYQPLHITKFYNGRSSYGNGVHSRYESSLIARDSARLICLPENISYVQNINSFVFDFLYSNHKYVDSVLIADSLSHLAAGNTNSTLYYDTFWSLAGNSTIMLFKNASKFLATLIYTCWINAESPVPTMISEQTNIAGEYKLYQNYPNPFNPVTTIKFELNKPEFVSLKIYDIQGKEVQTLLNENKKPGNYEINFNGTNLSSGMYFYNMTAGDFKETRKMFLIK